jgi:TIR domain
MPGVFLSYRREDSSGYAGRLYDILSAQFGSDNVYMDVDSIAGGDEFATKIEENINRAEVLVAVIGSRWLTATDKNGGRRLDSANDFVRTEISMALQRGIRVIPVLVGGATVPGADELPDSLRTLVERQAIEIRDQNFRPDAQRLTDVLQKEFRMTKNLAKPPVDVAGKWHASVTYDWGATYDTILEFEVDGSTLSGTAGYLADKEGDGRTILDGKLTENRISFTTKSWSMSGRDRFEESHRYMGTVEGDSIHFTLRTDDTAYSYHRRVAFVARRVQPDPPRE